MPTNSQQPTRLQILEIVQLHVESWNVEMKTGQEPNWIQRGKKEEKMEVKHWRALFHLFIIVNWFIQLMSPLNGRGTIEKNEALLTYYHHLKWVFWKWKMKSRWMNNFCFSFYHHFILHGWHWEWKVETVSVCIHFYAFKCNVVCISIHIWPL